MPQKYKKRKDGRYLVQIQIGYQDNDKPKYKNIYGRTIPELDIKMTEFKTNLYKGIIIDDKNLTLGEWAEHWVSIKVIPKKASTGQLLITIYRLLKI